MLKKTVIAVIVMMLILAMMLSACSGGWKESYDSFLDDHVGKVGKRANGDDDQLAGVLLGHLIHVVPCGELVVGGHGGRQGVLHDDKSP